MRIITFLLDPRTIERMESLRDPACGDDCGTSVSRRLADISITDSG